MRRLIHLLSGQLSGTPISGAILDATGGDYRAVIAWSGGIMTIGALFAVWARFISLSHAFEALIKADPFSCQVEPKVFKTV